MSGAEKDSIKQDLAFINSMLTDRVATYSGRYLIHHRIVQRRVERKVQEENYTNESMRSSENLPCCSNQNPSSEQECGYDYDDDVEDDYGENDECERSVEEPSPQ